MKKLNLAIFRLIQGGTSSKTKIYKSTLSWWEFMLSDGMLQCFQIHMHSSHKPPYLDTASSPVAFSVKVGMG